MKSQSFLRMFRAYLVVVTVLVLMMIPLCLQMIAVTRERELSDAKAMMESGMNLLVSQLDSMQSILNSAQASTPLTKVSTMKKPLRSSDYYTLLKAQQYVAALSGANSFVTDLLVYFGQSDILLSGKTTFIDLPSFYKYYDIGDISQILSSSPASPFHFYQETTLSYPLFSSQESPVMLYRLPVALSVNYGGRGAAYVLIDKAHFMSLALPVSILKHGTVTLTDADGRLIAGLGNETEIERLLSAGPEDAQDSRITVAAGHRSGLKMTLSLPWHIFARSLSGVFATIGLYIVAILTAGIAASLIASYRQAKPLNQLLSQLQTLGLSREDNRSAYDFIAASFQRLSRERHSIASQLEDSKAALKSNMIDRVLNSTLVSHQLKKQALEVLSQFPARYIVCYGAFTSPQGIKELGVLGPLMFSHLRHAVGQETIVHRIDEHTFALILPVEGDEAPVARLLAMMERVNKDLPLTLTMAISSPVEGMDMANTAFEQARLSYVLGDRSQPLILPSAAQENTQFGIKDSLSLYRSIAAGDEAASQACIERLLDTAHMPQADLEQAYSIVRMTMLFAARDCIGAQCPLPHIPKYKNLQNVDSLRRVLHEKNGEICRLVNERKRSNNQMLKQRILDFVNENYQDGDLYGKALADRFHVSQKYLYNFFKEQTGYSLGDYLMHLRLSRAAELLQHTRDSIGSIWAACGFSSQNTFYKAFKRDFGVSPSEYRERHLANSSEIHA